VSEAPRAPARFVVGIDLGTTNSAVASARTGSAASVEVFPIAQLVAEGEVLPRASLPSAIYLAGEHDVPAGALALPWADDARFAVGALARRLGDRVAGRLITSSKSWLCHGGVDRTAAILPWGGDPEAGKLSPVAASARILEHVRAAWDTAHPDAPLHAQSVVLTVPASFDEVARELTVQAAAQAGLERVRLLEEPQAAIYAWIGAHPSWREQLVPDSTVLVVDIGGGTTDFSLVAVRRGVDGLALERIAVGEHLLLGGDNVDLALARLIAERSPEARGLDAARWQQLTSLCRDAKERLLGDQPPASVAVTVPGRGRSLVKGTVSATLTLDDVLRVVVDGFVPPVERDAQPRAGDGAGLTEFGLPYASDPQITRHLASFLAAARDPGTGDGIARPIAAPSAVLFNGGALKATAMRARILDALESWYGSRPVDLAGADLELAVARGAAVYGLALRGVGARIAGGAARAYYVGVAAGEAESSSNGQRRVLCVAPRGMQEGAEIEIAVPEFEVLANAPVRFPIFASSTRTGDVAGALLDVDPATVVELPPISTVLRFGRSLAARSIAVHLRAILTETGTLELWCLSRQTDHRWRLNFDLRGRERRLEAASAPGTPDSPSAADESHVNVSSDGEVAPTAGGSQEMVISEERVAAARALLEECFASRPGSDPKLLMRALEDALDAGRDGWPVGCVRRLWDALFELEAARERTPEHEARWLNLAGYLLRPGFGEERDAWRVEHLWRRFDAGQRFASAPQVRAEWWTMWKRVSGGLTRQQQQALLAYIRPALLPQQTKKAKVRFKAGPQELRELWQVAASLEKLPAGVRQELAAALAPRVAKGKTTGDAEIWALGRLAARVPVAGPVSSVIEPRVVEPWLEALLGAPWERRAALALAVGQMARLTGDRARDVAPELRERLAERIASEPEGRRFARWLREVVTIGAQDQALVLAESLPVGLRLANAPS